jgi:hypothetical protein
MGYSTLVYNLEDRSLTFFSNGLYNESETEMHLDIYTLNTNFNVILVHSFSKNDCDFRKVSNDEFDEIVEDYISENKILKRQIKIEYDNFVLDRFNVCEKTYRFANELSSSFTLYQFSEKESW